MIQNPPVCNLCRGPCVNPREHFALGGPSQDSQVAALRVPVLSGVRGFSWKFKEVDNRRLEERKEREQVTWVYESTDPKGFRRETTFFLDNCPRNVPSERIYVHVESGQKTQTLDGLLTLLASQ